MPIELNAARGPEQRNPPKAMDSTYSGSHSIASPSMTKARGAARDKKGSGGRDNRVCLPSPPPRNHAYGFAGRVDYGRTTELDALLLFFLCLLREKMKLRSLRDNRRRNKIDNECMYLTYVSVSRLYK
jgi:hypothetical protein